MMCKSICVFRHRQKAPPSVNETSFPFFGKKKCQGKLINVHAVMRCGWTERRTSEQTTGLLRRKSCLCAGEKWISCCPRYVVLMKSIREAGTFDRKEEGNQSGSSCGDQRASVAGGDGLRGPHSKYFSPESHLSLKAFH